MIYFLFWFAIGLFTYDNHGKVPYYLSIPTAVVLLVLLLIIAKKISKLDTDEVRVYIALFTVLCGISVVGMILYQAIKAHELSTMLLHLIFGPIGFSL